jgi:Ca2+-binding RTX toxin-like protein
MAIFTCAVSTNIFGNGSPGKFELSAGDGSFFELDSSKFYELFGGSFNYYADGTPYGYVYTYRVFDNGNNQTRFWDADGGFYRAEDMYSLKESGSWRDYFEYIFYLNDKIYGSASRDKLNGYRGDDFIVGNEGNDTLKGGPGRDGFYFEAYDGRDVIKDFKWRYDTIWLDQSLATTINEIYNAATVYKKFVILDFGSTVIKIGKLKPGDFEDVDFGFL